jgi:hypothetical protein
MTAESLELPGIDGANPLGFLAALGTLVTVRQAGEKQARLRWKRARTWIPMLDGISTSDPDKLSETVARALRGRAVSDRKAKKRADAEARFAIVKRWVDHTRKEISSRGLSRQSREAALAAEVLPMERFRDRLRRRWLRALKNAVPRPELAIGKRIDCTYEEYREHAGDFLVGAGHSDRETLDLLAAFGSDACREERSDAIVPTPFCFIRGSGQQFFLDTVRQLMEQVTPERVRQTLFEPWAYRDQTLSMRWDPIEDRRYALMDRDPTASDNKSRTVWMANLLAYRGLTLFPCAPGRRGLATTAWALLDDAEPAFTWPMWEFSASPDAIRSLLQLRELTEPRLDQASLLERGVPAVFRARRIKVGRGSNYKLNFSPARAVSARARGHA